MMKGTRTAITLMLLVAAACSATACYAQVAKVNGVTIPQSRVEMLIKNAIAQGQTDTPELRNRIREVLISQEIVAQEAIKKGLDKSPDVVAQIETGRQQVLANAYMQDYFKNNPITDEIMKREYDSAKALAGAREFKAHHILVKQEDEARQIIAQLKKGANFEKLAAEKSVDPGSKTNGGDLGWGNRYVAPFVAALEKLKKGQLTDAPVKTDFGWHVIRLDDERAMTFPPFEEVKGQIFQQMQSQVAQKAIADLRAKAKIE